MSDWPTESEIKSMFPTKQGFGADVTPSSAMELPEVKELMEAMERAIEAIDAAYDGPDDNGAYTVRERRPRRNQGAKDMTDRPIIFSAPMVRALLDGRKTQTRRVLKPQPHERAKGCYRRPDGSWVWVDAHREGNGTGYDGNRLDDRHFFTPYAPGDRLYVREAHYMTDDGDTEYAVFAEDQASVAEHIENMHRIMASHPQIDWSKHLRPRPSIHMPRWASRLTLTVTDVRVQRLQDCSAADAVAEGCKGFVSQDGEDGLSPQEEYRDLWNSLHGPGAWESNPWVAAYTFDVKMGNIDQ